MSDEHHEDHGGGDGGITAQKLLSLPTLLMAGLVVVLIFGAISASGIPFVAGRMAAQIPFAVGDFCAGLTGSKCFFESEAGTIDWGPLHFDKPGFKVEAPVTGQFSTGTTANPKTNNSVTINLVPTPAATARPQLPGQGAAAVPTVNAQQNQALAAQYIQTANALWAAGDWAGAQSAATEAMKLGTVWDKTAQATLVKTKIAQLQSLSGTQEYDRMLALVREIRTINASIPGLDEIESDATAKKAETQRVDKARNDWSAALAQMPKLSGWVASNSGFSESTVNALLKGRKVRITKVDEPNGPGIYGDLMKNFRGDGDPVTLQVDPPPGAENMAKGSIVIPRYVWKAWTGGNEPVVGTEITVP